MAETLPAAASALLHDGLAALGQDPALAPPLLEYLALLASWNRAYNLTAVRDPLEMVPRHLLDSLSIAPAVAAHCSSPGPRPPLPGLEDRDGPRLVDIGTGAGLPGIPLALAMPQLSVTLVETVGKKARFLRQAVRQLGLSGRVRVLESRGEAVDEPGAHDCLVARALGTLAMLLATGGHLLRPGGWLLAMKGQRPHEELGALPAGWQPPQVLPLAVPGLAAERHLVALRRDDTATTTRTT